ncbi:MAG TPA: hypothetical protein PKW45_11635 [Bryobacteraceae bacterium]|nr:hypothetical protein [Bryobacteraceae bacterium]
MMIEFGDRGEEEQRLLLRYLEAAKSQPPAAREPKPGCFWLLIGRFYLAYLRWRYRSRSQ